MNKKESRSFNIINMIIAPLGCISLACIYRSLYSNYIGLFSTTLGENDIVEYAIAIILGVLLALLLIANTVGAYSRKFRETIVKIESRYSWIPIAEIVYLILSYMDMIFMMVIMTFFDIFIVSINVLITYPLYFLCIFIHMGFTLATKFKVIKRINEMKRMAYNAVNPFMNPMMYQGGGYGYPQQGEYPQYPNYPEQQYPPYPQYPDYTQQQYPQYKMQNPYSNIEAAQQGASDYDIPQDMWQGRQ